MAEKFGLQLCAEHRLKGVTEHMLLREVFGPKRKEATRGRIKLHNAELNDF
jgi:hypothetical protein